MLIFTMLIYYFKTVKMSYAKAFDCYGMDSKIQYRCIFPFQLCWFLFYLWIPYESAFSFILFLLFLLPNVSRNARCINYYGYSRALCALYG